MKNVISKLLIPLLTFSGITATSLADIIIADTFDSPSTPAAVGRIYENQLDGGWYKTSPYSTHIVSAWDITGGRLENATADTISYVQSETPAYQWLSNPLAGSTSDEKITIGFDYGVGTGDTLTFHLWAVQTGGVAGAATFISNNQGWINGNSDQNQTNSVNGSTPYNLLNGSNAPSNSPLIAGLTGTGAHSSWVDLSGLSIPGVTTVGDIDGFLIAFAGNETGGGTTFVDNLSIASSVIPEPSSLALVLLGVALLGSRRQRLHM